MRKSEVVSWYLEQIQDTIDSEEDLIEKKEIVEKVIDRLIYKVKKKTDSNFYIECYEFV